MRKSHSRPGDVVNRLVQDQMAAVETYRQALEKFSGGASGQTLRRFLAEHEDTLLALKTHAAALTEPAKTSGAWGAWAKLVEGAAKLFGEEAALKALKEGEEHGINAYERALKEEGLPEVLRQRIKDEFLPTSRDHITALDALIRKTGVFGTGKD